jgi:DNA-binding SARP family transcriptional activator
MTLKISLLGQFNLQAEDVSLELPSRPAQSLLAYLAIHAGSVHRRETLAHLLWPDSTESNARSYLRQALWRIRKSFEIASKDWEDHLKISDINVTFDDQSDYWLDVEVLMKSEDEEAIEQLITTISLYRGELLPGFYDEWINPERNRVLATYHQRMNQLLKRLEETGRWQEVLEWGERWIQLGNSPEQAFRALIKAYGQLGDQGMVSATYQRCVEALNRELGLDPSPETRRLYEQILQKDSEVIVPSSIPAIGHSVEQPRFLDDADPDRFERPVFVAREDELTQLEDHLELTLSGKGHVIFITGEAGSGKSTLIQEFTQRAQDSQPDLIVASGNCNAHTGIGDPYLPFREILGLLTGDVEARWAGGTLSRSHALRLWNSLPHTSRALVENGPDLIDTFVAGAPLMKRINAYTPEHADWLIRLREITQRQDVRQYVPNLQQSNLFDQYTRVIRTLSRKAPIVLVLDDLQWADNGSIELLFHLGRQLSGNPILVIGAYREEEIAMGRKGTRHPLEPVLNEFQRAFGAITVDLGKADRRDFVEKLIDSEQNQLGPSFRAMLQRQTQGHPLFTIELLRGMQLRGDLVKTPDGDWIEGTTLDWDTLPARVEAVVVERTQRLSPQLQEILKVASVEGEVFTAEVIAQILEVDEKELLTQLSGELDRKHRLIRVERIQRLGGQLISSYRFHHMMFQKYLYSLLDEVERVHLHEQVGFALESLYLIQEQLPEIALQLARHFEEAEIPEKTIHYLQQAGERAVYLSAYPEGIAHLNRGLEMLKRIPASPERDQLELTLQLSLGMAWKYNWASPHGREAIDRARSLCMEMGAIDKLSRVLGELCIYHYVHAEYHQGIEWAKEALHLAQQEQDPVLIAEGNWYLGFLNLCLGNYLTAHEHLKEMIDFYIPEQHHYALVTLRGTDAGLSALAYDACCLWSLGFPDQARALSQEALDLAHRFDHTFTLADVLCYAGCMFNAMLGDVDTLEVYADALIQISDQEGLYLSGWSGMATNFKGVSLTMRGKGEEAIKQIEKSIRNSELSGVLLYNTISLQSLAKAHLNAGNFHAAIENLNQAITLAQETGDRHWKPELHRLMGEVLILLRDFSKAENHFENALSIAREQEAKSWELRAATSLAKLWHEQGRSEDARALLESIYTWFTEGFDTPDLINAKQVLDELT